MSVANERIVLFIAFIVPSRREAGMCSFIRLDNRLAVCPIYRVLQEHVNQYNTED